MRCPPCPHRAHHVAVDAPRNTSSLGLTKWGERALHFSQGTVTTELFENQNHSKHILFYPTFSLSMFSSKPSRKW